MLDLQKPFGTRPAARLARLVCIAFVVLTATVSSPAGPASAVTSWAVNLAVTGKATQSSTSHGGTANRAIDGNTDGNWGRSSTTHTGKTANPWWQVDLTASYDIESINIWNRTDCCADRLGDYWVFLSPLPFKSNDPKVLAADSGVTSIHVAPGLATRPPVGRPDLNIPAVALARYVRVQLTGTNFLSLAEVQVMGSRYFTNYASTAAVSQSSTAYGGLAAYAKDGLTDGGFGHRSVTATAREFRPWWQADLGQNRRIVDIRVWNRTDCCADRLSGFWVYLSQLPITSNDPAQIAKLPGLTAIHIDKAPSPVTILPINAWGRYARVQLDGTNFLSLAEVEINGAPGDGWLPADELAPPATELSPPATEPAPPATQPG